MMMILIGVSLGGRRRSRVRISYESKGKSEMFKDL